MGKQFKKWIWGGIAILVTGTITWALVYFPPSSLKIQEVVVLTPLQHLSELDLIRLSEVRRGDNLLTLRLGQVRSKIRRFPWIHEVRLSKRFPGRLLIWAEEEKPIALLEMKDLYLVSREGRIFKKLNASGVSGSKDPRDLPILTGLEEKELATHLKELISLLGLFEKITGENSEGLKSVGLSEIHWNENRGVSLFTREPCVRLEIGEGGWTEKLERLSRAWETIRSTARRPRIIDLNFEKKIVVKQKGGDFDG